MIDILDTRFGQYGAIVALAVLSFVVGRGLRTWLDTGRFGWPPARRLAWALGGAVTPTRYWWGARIDALPQAEKEALLGYETRLLWLEQADSLRCPLCRAEIPNAWVLDEAGQVTVAPPLALHRPPDAVAHTCPRLSCATASGGQRQGDKRDTCACAQCRCGPASGRAPPGPEGGPVQCPRCDFRLDACRHCAHFLPGAPQAWYTAAWNQPDGTWGRCGHYKRSQPVEDAVDPDMARTLRQQGYEEIRAPMRIADSMLRPDFCRAFSLDRRRLRQASRVRVPGRKRAALLRILEEQRRRT